MDYSRQYLIFSLNRFHEIRRFQKQFKKIRLRIFDTGVSAMTVSAIPKEIIQDKEFMLKLRAFLKNPVSRKSCEFAISILGVRPATNIYSELVNLFDKKVAPHSISISVQDFRRSLSSSGITQSLFRKYKGNTDTFLEGKLSYWLDQGRDNNAKLANDLPTWEVNLLPQYVALFGLHEHIFFALAGLGKFIQEENVDTLVLNDYTLEATFLKWYSGFLNQQAQMSIHLGLGRLVGINLFRTKIASTDFSRISPESLDMAAYFFLDRCYSINSRYINTKLSEKIDLENAIQFLRWICFLFLWQDIHPGEYFFFDSDLVDRLMLSKKEIPKLVSIAEQSDGTDTVLKLDERKGIRISGEFSPGYLSEALRGHVIQRTSVSFVGNWFEEEYLIPYITGDINQEWYRIYPGLKSKKSEPILGYDIDFIVEDIRRDIFYFVQAKYKSKAYLTYLYDEFDTVHVQENGISSGIRQLKSIAGNFHQEKILKRIYSSTQRKFSPEELDQKAKFILLHNLDSIDLTQFEDIAAYNWNFFRNLLRGKTTESIYEGSQIRDESIIHGEALPLENTHLVAEKMSKNLRSDSGGHANMLNSWSVYTEIKIHLSSIKEPSEKVVFGLC